ncbi:MAG: branched-chain amino acid ABC transporter permease, partial [Desulfamplus sp.]|nr:branched-chain amino acid ABC transporter permease [Desulfamplus sp.]
MSLNKKSFATWIRSAAGITISISVALALFAAINSGPYVLVNVIITGGMLALVATGLTLILGVLNIAMFAHGEYFMIGSLTAYYVFTPISNYVNENPDSILAIVGPLIAIILSMVSGAIAGVISEKVVFGPLRRRSTDNWVMNSFLLTVGLSVLLINLHQLIFGADFKGIVKYWGGMPIEIAGAFIARDRVMAFIISCVIVFLFWFFMTYTRTGRAIRAVSQDVNGAKIVGINIEKIVLLTIALSCALSAVAGGSLLFMYPSYPTMGLEPL